MRGRCGAIPHVNVYNIYMAVAIAFVKRGGAGRSEAFRAALGPIRPGAKRASLRKQLGRPGPQTCRCCGPGSSPLSSHHPCAARTPAVGRWQAQPRPCQRARAEPAPHTVPQRPTPLPEARARPRQPAAAFPAAQAWARPSRSCGDALSINGAAAFVGCFRPSGPVRVAVKRLVGPHAVGIACRKASAPGCRVGRNRPATCSGVAR